jgi:DNA-binding PadR family transcriptional regulator
VGTPYEFQKAAGISQGASVPALQRLVEAGFIRQGKPGLRGRTDYRATAAGSKALKIRWRGLIGTGPSGDLGADLRVALLALWVGGDRRLAAEFLSQSAEQKIEYLNSIEQEDGYAGVAPLARWYSSLRLTATKTLIEAESAATRTMAESLPESTLVKPSREAAAPRNQDAFEDVPKGCFEVLSHSTLMLPCPWLCGQSRVVRRCLDSVFAPAAGSGKSLFQFG